VSGDLTSGTGFDALAVLPPGAETLRRGARVPAIVLRAGAHPPPAGQRSAAPRFSRSTRKRASRR
jgi:hypothetical protein